MTRFLPPWLVFGVGVVWAFGILAATRYQDRPPTAEEANIAVHLAHGEGFRSPMDPSPSAPPSAWSPPIYPLVLAAVYWAFGVATPRALLATATLNAVCFGLIAVTFIGLSKTIFRSRTPGLAAAVIFALSPAALLAIDDFWDGILALALFGSILMVVVARTDSARSSLSLSATILLGAAMGVLALTNASYVVAFPILLVTGSRTSARFDWRRMAAMTVSLILVVGLWTIRNYVALGDVIPIRTGAGVQFWLGNAPISHGWLDAHAYAHHPFVNADERAALLAEDEGAYDRAAFGRFENGVIADPTRYADDCLRRVAYLLVGNWSAAATSPILIAVNVVIALAGLLGMLMVWRMNIRQHWLPGIMCAIALPFVPTAVIDRYRLPLEYLIVFYAGALVWLSVGTWSNKRGAVHRG